MKGFKISILSGDSLETAEISFFSGAQKFQVVIFGTYNGNRSGFLIKKWTICFFGTFKIKNLPNFRIDFWLVRICIPYFKFVTRWEIILNFECIGKRNLYLGELKNKHH